MPMLKTVSIGRGSLASLRNYLMGSISEETRTLLQEQSKAAPPLSSGEFSDTIDSGALDAYLVRDERHLALDVSEDLNPAQWSLQMDLTRARMGHDKPTKRGQPRCYYHFVLSPNPDDACSLETLRAYAVAWTRENFRCMGHTHQYAIVYHDDNVRAVPHAHIVVNVSNLATGKKLHVDNDRVVALQISAQTVGERFGLAPIREQMQDTIGARTTQPIYLDRREREVINSGKKSWKWELRELIGTTADLSSGFDDFKSRLNAHGYDVVRHEQTGYLTYTHANGLRVKDCKLGADFYLEQLEQRFDRGRPSPFAGKNYAAWELIKISRGQVPWKEDIRRAIDDVAPHVLTLDELRAALRERHNIRLIVNPRGITYYHSCGFKTRDVSLGFRYTATGLRSLAIAGSMEGMHTLPQIVEEYAAFYTVALRGAPLHPPKQSLLSRQVGKPISFDDFAAWQIGVAMEHLLAETGLERLEDVQPYLAHTRTACAAEKTALEEMREELLYLQRVEVARSIREDSVSEIDDETVEVEEPTAQATAQVPIQGEALRERHDSLALTYQERLAAHLERVERLAAQQTIYQNYLESRSTSFGSAVTIDEHATSKDSITSPVLSVAGMAAANRTLERRDITSYVHLEAVMKRDAHTTDVLAQRVDAAANELLSSGDIYHDVLTCELSRRYLQQDDATVPHPMQQELFADYNAARDRLVAAGIKPADYATIKSEHQEKVTNLRSLRADHKSAVSNLGELTGAMAICKQAANELANSRLVAKVEPLISEQPAAKPDIDQMVRLAKQRALEANKLVREERRERGRGR